MLLVYLFRVVLILFLLRVAFRFLSGVLLGLAGPAQPRVAPPVGVPTVRDLVCNTFLPRDRAIVVTRDGREQYFCSTACRDKALSTIDAA
jgi:hypothetical protein